jgi:hypothetical protein
MDSGIDSTINASFKKEAISFNVLSNELLAKPYLLENTLPMRKVIPTTILTPINPETI